MSLPEPYWRSPDGRHVLYCGDCLAILPHVGRVDAVVTDPPYGIGHLHSGVGRCVNGRLSLRRFAEPIASDSCPFDPSPFLRWPCVLFGADHYCGSLPNGGTMHVWDKAYSGGPADSFSDAELFWTSWQCSRVVVRYLWKGVCQDGEKGQRKFHPAQKPIAVMRRCVEMTNADTILDPFAGSGTTLVAAHRTGRRSIGIEIEPRYCEIVVKRMERELAQPFLPGMEPHAETRQAELFEVSA